MTKINVSILLIIGLFLHGCGNAQPQVSDSTKTQVFSSKKSLALYDGQLVRAKLKLDPKKPLSKEFIQELKEDYLDQHFSGSKENTYIIYSKTESFYYKCKKVKRKNVANVKINGKVRYTIKQVHPIKQVVHTSVIPYYEDATIASTSCYSRQENLEPLFKENMLTKTTEMFSLYMEEAEGKDVKEQIKVAKNGLSGTYKSIGASFQEASHAVFSPIGKFLKSGGSMTQAEAASMSAAMNNSFRKASRQLNDAHSSFNNNMYGSPSVNTTTYSTSSSKASSRNKGSSSSSNSSRSNGGSNITLDSVKKTKSTYVKDDSEWRAYLAKEKRNKEELQRISDNRPTFKHTRFYAPGEAPARKYKVKAGTGSSK